MLFNATLRPAKVLLGIPEPPVLGIHLRLQLTDARLHLHHGLLASFESIGLCLVSPRLGILALTLEELSISFQISSKILFSPEFISKAGGINHGLGRLLLGKTGLVGHFIKVGMESVHLRLNFPLGCRNRLVLVGQIRQRLIAIRQVLFYGPALSVSLLKQSPGLLKGILHSCRLAIGNHLGINSSSFQAGLFITFHLGISDLLCVPLDSSLGFEGPSIGMLKSNIKICNIGFKFLLHAKSFSFALGFGLEGRLHSLNGLCLVLFNGHELLLLLSNASFNFCSHLAELELGPKNLVFLLFESSLGLFQSSLQLQFLSLQALPNLVNLVNVTSSLADLVHDVLDLVGQRLVLPPHLVQLQNRLFIGCLHPEQFRGSVACLLLADVEIVRQRVNLGLPLANELVELFSLSLHSSVEDLRLVEIGAHVLQFCMKLGSCLLGLVQLGSLAVDSTLSLG